MSTDETPYKYFSEHEVWWLIGRVIDQLSGFYQSDREFDPFTLEQIARIETVARLTRTRLLNIEPAFVADFVLDDLAKALDKIRGNLDIYWDSREISFISLAAKHVDDVLKSICFIPMLSDASDLTDAILSIAQYRDSVIKAFEQHQRNADTLRARIAHLDNEFAIFKRLLSDELQKIPTVESRVIEQANVAMTEFKKREIEIATLVATLGGKGLTSGHQAAADKARNEARFWRGITVLSICVFAIVALYEFLPSLKDAFSWTQVISRFVISLPLVLLVTYAARQSSSYQRSFQRNEKMALELAALNPFIIDLPTEQQHKFKISIGERSFAQVEPQSQDVPSIADMVKSKELFDFIVNIVKSVK